ncbi:uncharacterized protein LOC127799751 [Diospyros lotus]|uniref:uncharacterized protein LOC127799751 n=1 Tax=Diospyros lotus TaxID=55363 RepID=UPI00224D9D6D|nr:uncharacterized protein LOC127799751 [Diospyros lotus]
MAKNPLAGLLDTNKLTGPNYLDWLRNLKIVLDSEKITYVMDKAPPEKVLEASTREELTTWQKWKDDDLQARCYMMASMSNELQKQHEKMEHAAEIHLHLQELYGEQTRHVRYQISKELFRARMTDTESVNTHVLKMISLIEKLESLSVVMDNDLYVDLILQSLPDSFDHFVMNFNMHKLETTLPELLNMLKTAEMTMKKDKPIMLIGSSHSSKPKKNWSKQGKGEEFSKGEDKAKGWS